MIFYIILINVNMNMKNPENFLTFKKYNYNMVNYNKCGKIL